MRALIAGAALLLAVGAAAHLMRAPHGHHRGYVVVSSDTILNFGAMLDEDMVLPADAVNTSTNWTPIKWKDRLGRIWQLGLVGANHGQDFGPVAWRRFRGGGFGE